MKRGRAMSEARALLVLLEDGEGLCVHAVAGEVSSDLVGPRFRPATSLARARSSSRAPLLETGAGAVDPDGTPAHRRSRNARSALVVPLGFRGRARGVLIAFDRMADDAPFGADDEHLLSSFAASAAIAIATAQSVGAAGCAAQRGRRRRSARAGRGSARRDSSGARCAEGRARHHATIQDAGVTRGALETALSHIDTSIRNLQSLITSSGLPPLTNRAHAALEALLDRIAATSGLDVEARLRLRIADGRAPTRLEARSRAPCTAFVQRALLATWSEQRNPPSASID